MEAIKIVEQYWEQLKRLAVYAQYCLNNDIHSPVCRDFWIRSVVMAFGVAVLVVALIAKRIIKEQLEFHRNRKRLAARAVIADADIMNEHRWAGDDADQMDLPQEDLAAEIRKAVKSSNPPSNENA